MPLGVISPIWKEDPKETGLHLPGTFSCADGNFSVAADGTVTAGGGGGETWTLVDADFAGSPYTPANGSNTWYRCVTDAGDIVINPAAAPVEGDQILISSLGGGHLVHSPSGGPAVTLADNQSQLMRFDGTHGYYVALDIPPVDAAADPGLLQWAAYNDNTGKALGTTYTAGSRRLLVMVGLHCSIPASGTSGWDAFVDPHVTIAGVTRDLASVGLTNVATGAAFMQAFFPATFVVDPGGTYTLQDRSFGGNVTVQSWSEIEF